MRRLEALALLTVGTTICAASPAFSSTASKPAPTRSRVVTLKYDKPCFVEVLTPALTTFAGNCPHSLGITIRNGERVAKFMITDDSGRPAPILVGPAGDAENAALVCQIGAVPVRNGDELLLRPAIRAGATDCVAATSGTITVTLTS
jgi:hypothetical protein